MLEIAQSATRVKDHTRQDVNAHISEAARARIAYYATHPERINERLHQLEQEWDIERWLQLNSSALSMFGLLRGMLGKRRWLMLPFAVQGFFLRHGLEGWCPPVPALRSLGVRTMSEIESERHALKALRGDFEQANEKDSVSALKAASADGLGPEEIKPALESTTQRVPDNTREDLNARIREEMEQRLAFYAAHPELCERRLAELDREWDIERLIEVEAPTVSLTGLVFGILGSRRWLAVPFLAQSMMLVHAVQGFYPLLPLFRRMGFRTEDEIALERYAIKALRGDFKNIHPQSLHDQWAEQADQAFSAAQSKEH